MFMKFIQMSKYLMPLDKKDNLCYNDIELGTTRSSVKARAG